MTLEEATKHIKACAEQMNALYAQVVFDELTIVSLVEKKGRMVWYHGPRKENFQQNFASDVEALHAELVSEKHDPGDFEFARHAGGTHFDAFMVVGHGLYLICNNTHSSMSAISKDPRWLSAQVPFVDLSDKFRARPLGPV